MPSFVLRSLAACGMLAIGQLATAHVTLEQPSAAAGSYYKASLRITHGCDGSATKAVTVFLPTGFEGAKPMPKPGWQITVGSSPLAQPYLRHGKTISQEVSQISWTGGLLADGYFDEFAVLGKLPATAGKLYFKVLQECETGKNEWFAIPAAGQSAHDVAQPAVELTVTAPTPQAHQHPH